MGVKMLDFYKGKKVLITGHTGFKGSWMCQVLLEAGANVIGYALEPPTQPGLFELAGLEKEMHSVTGDIRDLEKGIYRKTYRDCNSYGGTTHSKRILQGSGLYL